MLLACLTWQLFTHTYFLEVISLHSKITANLSLNSKCNFLSYLCSTCLSPSWQFLALTCKEEIENNSDIPNNPHSAMYIKKTLSLSQNNFIDSEKISFYLIGSQKRRKPIEA